jgi:hypothetical protein
VDVSVVVVVHVAVAVITSFIDPTHKEHREYRNQPRKGSRSWVSWRPEWSQCQCITLSKANFYWMLCSDCM